MKLNDRVKLTFLLSVPPSTKFSLFPFNLWIWFEYITIYVWFGEGIHWARKHHTINVSHFGAGIFFLEKLFWCCGCVVTRFGCASECCQALHFLLPFYGPFFWSCQRHRVILQFSLSSWSVFYGHKIQYLNLFDWVAHVFIFILVMGCILN